MSCERHPQHIYVFSKHNRQQGKDRGKHIHHTSFKEMVNLGLQVESDNLAAGNHSSGSTRMIEQMQDSLAYSVKVAIRQGRRNQPREVTDLSVNPTEVIITEPNTLCTPSTPGNGVETPITRFYLRLERTMDLRNKH